MKLRPFWNYYGGKFRLAPRYAAPRFSTIVEPFAGAAGYALRNHERDVILIDRSPIICEIWRFLIGATSDDIRRIPYVEHVDELPGWVCQGARWLVGFSMNAATTAPCKQLSAGRKRLRDLGRKYQGWTDAHKETIASQVGVIRHWKIIEGDYTAAPAIEATWFVDPPYQQAGKFYKAQPSDFYALGDWCRSLSGQVMVCENVGADWLPFRPFVYAKSAMRPGTTNREAIWTNDGAGEP
jgi:site-specific DNA-adenine methylase